MHRPGENCLRSHREDSTIMAQPFSSDIQVARWHEITRNPAGCAMLQIIYIAPGRPEVGALQAQRAPHGGGQGALTARDPRECLDSSSILPLVLALLIPSRQVLLGQPLPAGEGKFVPRLRCRYVRLMSVQCSSSLPERHTIPSPESSLSRRRFLRSAALLSAAAGLPAVVPASVLGAEGRPAPSNRITVGCIGVGGMGNGNLGGFLGDPRCQVLAVRRCGPQCL